MFWPGPGHTARQAPLLSVVLNDQPQIEKEESQEMQVPKR
jgi:hypothetical protein